MTTLKPWWLVALLLSALAVSGCGQSSAAAGPTLAAVPLAGGTRVVAHIRRCDRGTNPYCSVQLVVLGRRYRSSAALMSGERRQLSAIGWTKAGVDTGHEQAADSPGHKLRLTYATAADDLNAVDQGWIRRAPTIALSLSRAMFEREPVISLMLETGPS